VKYIYASATVILALFLAVLLFDANPKQAMFLSLLQLGAILLVWIFEEAKGDK
jgi:hypothetical protein